MNCQEKPNDSLNNGFRKQNSHEAFDDVQIPKDGGNDLLHEGEALERVRHDDEGVGEGPGQMEIEGKADSLPFQAQEGVEYRVKEIAGLALHAESGNKVQLGACKNGNILL